MKRILSLIRQKRHKWTPRFDEAVTYCLRCKNFYVGIGKTTRTACNRLRGKIGAVCCIERDGLKMTKFKAVRRRKNKKNLVSYDRKIIEGLHLRHANKENTRVFPALYSEKNAYEKDSNYRECKKLFVSSFKKFLKGERCPLSPEDRKCEFFFERSMEKWNKK